MSWARCRPAGGGAAGRADRASPKLSSCILRGTPPDAIYIFKHALLQDAAYSTMLRARRQQLHSAIALVLEKRFPDVVNATPEVVGQQFEQAAQSEKAIDYYQKAADRDLRRFAMKESIAHYTNALRLVSAMPESPGIRVWSGHLPRARHGATDRARSDLEGCTGEHDRALALSSTLPAHGRQLFLATWGIWFMRPCRAALWWRSSTPTNCGNRTRTRQSRSAARGLPRPRPGTAQDSGFPRPQGEFAG